MSYLRKRAVQAVREKGHSPEVVAQVMGFTRSSVYAWLVRYDRGGYEALNTRQAPGAEAVITAAIDDWLKATVLTSTPVAHGYDTVLWTRDLLADLINHTFGIVVSGQAVSWHLNRLGLSYQKPCYRDMERDDHEVTFFLEDKFPRIQRLAARLGADIGFEDEAGVGVRTRSGRTWGLVGQPPKVSVAMHRGGQNVISIVTAQGELRYSLSEQSVNAERYIQFLAQLIRGRQRPLILLVDQASFHHAHSVHQFVRAHRTQLRVFFLPKRSPELNPDEQVWQEVKTNRIGKQPVKNKRDLKQRLRSALRSLQHQTARIRSFFQLPDTQYASELCPLNN
jgi:transposase